MRDLTWKTWAVLYASATLVIITFLGLLNLTGCGRLPATSQEELREQCESNGDVLVEMASSSGSRFTACVPRELFVDPE